MGPPPPKNSDFHMCRSLSPVRLSPWMNKRGPAKASHTNTRATRPAPPAHTYTTLHASASQPARPPPAQTMPSRAHKGAKKDEENKPETQWLERHEKSKEKRYKKRWVYNDVEKRG